VKKKKKLLKIFFFCPCKGEYIEENQLASNLMSLHPLSIDEEINIGD